MKLSSHATAEYIHTASFLESVGLRSSNPPPRTPCSPYNCHIPDAGIPKSGVWLRVRSHHSSFRVFCLNHPMDSSLGSIFNHSSTYSQPTPLAGPNNLYPRPSPAHAHPQTTRSV